MKITGGLLAMVIFISACNTSTKTEGSETTQSTTAETAQVENTQTSAVVEQQTDLQASFKNIKGESVSLSQLKGKVVVMNFWATWCPPCIKELPSLQKLHQDLANEKDIVFMAIEVDQDIEKAAKFMAKNKFTIPLFTLDSELPQELMSNSIPMTVILAKNGDIVGKQVGMMDFGSEKLKEGLIELSKENER